MKRFFIFIVIIYIAFIFSLSTDIRSNEKSLEVSKVITTKISDYKVDVPVKSTMIKKVNFLLRKGAHFFLYFFFAIILSLGAIKLKLSFSKVAGYILFLCLFIANIDELIQKYVGHRTSEVKDCLIDLSGAAFGMILIFTLSYILEKYKLHKLHSLND